MFDPYSPTMYVLIIALMLGVVSLPVFRRADVPPSGKTDRLSALDGLRGFLAASVFLHHVAINYAYIRGGDWAVPPSHFYTLAGEGAVDLFFMITGFLFWSQLLKSRGQPGWIKLYVGRVFRIWPVYLAVVLPAMTLEMVHGGFHLAESGAEARQEFGRWLMAGMVPQFSFNNDTNFRHEMGMVWTLHFEWLFYLALLPLSLIARRATIHVPVVCGAMLAALAMSSVHVNGDHNPYILATIFLAGMAAGSLQACKLRPKAGPLALSTATACVLALALAFCESGYTLAAILFLGIAFYLLTSGSTLFGLLTWKPARRLGDISYGLYLGQGLVMYIVFESRRIRTFAVHGDLQFWTVAAGCAVLSVSFATLLHVFVENPGIAAGRRVANWVPARIVKQPA
jgi:peptidoglycan/LPS O-acetylase OafA/YrhL